MPISRAGIQVYATVNGLRPQIFQVLEVRISSGSNLLDYAAVQVDLGKIGKYVENLDLTNLTISGPNGDVNLAGAEMNIIAVVDGKQDVLHWGKVTGYEVDIGDDESINLISRLEESHFGVPLGFQRVIDPATNQPTYSDHDVLFNPQKRNDRLRPFEHEQILGNKRSGVSAAGLPYPVFIDPASVETQNAATYQKFGDFVNFNDPSLQAETAIDCWNLIEAVQYLCGECNPATRPDGSPAQITNPTFDELSAVLPTSRAILKNHLIRHGLYLPEALQQLLEPYGYLFRIDYQTTTFRKLTIFQGGKGPVKQVLWQPSQSNLFLPTQQADKVKLEYDKSMAVNQVKATGDYTYLEATWELMPAWDPSLDNLTFFDLFENGPGWAAHTDYHRVWRDWVLNEAGDYSRAWAPAGGPVFQAGIANPILTQYFGEAWGTTHPPLVARRRRFHPMLTRGPDGEPLGSAGGCEIEWWGNFTLSPKDGGGVTRTGPGWNNLWTYDSSQSVELLEHECGIRFTGASVPHFIRSLGANARVRITATIISDTRIVGFAPRRASSVNLDTNEAVLDVGSQFHARRLHNGSNYYSDVSNGLRQADQVDGRQALQEFTEQAQSSWDQAQCSGTIRLEGLDHMDFQVGDLISQIKGRNVNIGLNNAGASDTRYPQIVGITYYVQEQKTLITVNEFKETDAWIASFIRKTKHLK